MRVKLREERLTELELRGEILPATILNRSPLPLRIETGLWSYEVPPRPKGKAFSSFLVTNPTTYPVYEGNEEMSDGSKRKRFDVQVILPIKVAMEFKQFYMGSAGQDPASVRGGVVVFEGDVDGIKPGTSVRVPSYTYRKGTRYLTFHEAILKDLLDEADEKMKTYAMSILEQCDHWADDPKTRANIQRPERLWADFALEHNWIPSAKSWRNVTVSPENACPRCNAQFVSKTGACKCGYVFNPLLAYMSGECGIDHVRMNTLTKEQWAKVNVEEKRRQEARS